MPSIKSHFPIFKAHPDLIYLDNAATTQKPQIVIDAITHFYTHQNANIHRGIYQLAAQASQAYENTRTKLQKWLNAASRKEIIFTKGTTEAINLVAQSFLMPRLQKGDEVLISQMEHHANLIPWQLACQQKGAILKVIPITPTGSINQAAFEQLLNKKTKLLAITHISNTLGTINPIKKMITKAQEKDIPVLVDGAQSIAHYEIDVRDLEADFFVFSGHKMYAATGIGVLYGKKKWLESMTPYQVGGGMIRAVNFETTIAAPLPQKLEAGTPHIAGVLSLSKAVDFLQNLDQKAARKHLQELTNYAHQRLQSIKGVNIIGQAPEKSAIVSFVIDQIHPHDIASFLGQAQIATRAGHHCTQPLMEYFQIPATIRASFAPYNSFEDVDRLVETLVETQAFFAG